MLNKCVFYKGTVESIERKRSGDPTVPLSIVGLGHAVGVFSLDVYRQACGDEVGLNALIKVDLSLEERINIEEPRIAAFFISRKAVIRLRFTRRITIKVDKELQPEKCRSCVWGRFEGSKHFCPKIKCVKEPQNPKRLEKAVQ